MEIEERKMEMEVEDCSLWHYLIFCEEFVSDECENDFVCQVCKEPVSGHCAFKCLECSFAQHKSCTQLLDLAGTGVEHDITNRHHLILREEIEDDRHNKVICAGCGKLASSPAYRCSIPDCAFYLHKSCDQLSHTILHNAHPNHTLVLALPPWYHSCHVCKKDRRERTTLFYGCHLCNFEMDNKCANHWDIRKMEVGDYSLWHYLIFCEEVVNDDVICWVCEKPVSRHPAFKCLECSFVQHKSCSQLSNFAEMDVDHDIEDRHHLILKEEKENNGTKKIVCVGCGKLISSPAYRCSIPNCAFHLHKSCGQLSYAIPHNAHPDHTLFLSVSASYYRCDVCSEDKKKRTALHYRCRLCYFKIDNKCASHQDIIKSERKIEVGDCSIWHYLIFCEEFGNNDCKNNVVCWVCEEPVLEHPAFKCLECSFVQHKSCTQLLDLTKANEWHDINDRHHLILPEQMEDDSEKKVLCARCEKPAFSPTYRCSIPHCAFHLHKSCDQLSHAILHNAHPNHTLILSLSLHYCNVCSRYRKKRALLQYRCCICYFHMDYKCSSRWDIIGSERKMEVGDCSKWHYLIFCEEFVGDGDVCWVCEELLLGYPSFKCLECDFVQHKSCTQVTKMLYWHDITDRHHLISREEIKDNDKKKVVCARCGKLDSSPAYRCSILHCAFHLHKSCDQLSHAILHNAHPDHTFFLALPPSHRSCKVCSKVRKRRRTTLCYGCNLCYFHVDNKCASHWDIIESEARDCSMWHYLIFCEEFMRDDCENEVDCWVCEKSVVGYPVFKCLECSFVQHKSCTQLTDLKEMNVRHDIMGKHHLILHGETKNNAKGKVVCAGCGKVASGPTYRCSMPKCTFRLHKACHQLSLATQHVTHPEHPLVLTLPTLAAWCGFCGKDRKKETTLLYSCRPCNFDIDNECASFLKIIDGNCDRHAFILCRKPIPFKCEACGETTNDIACQCRICGILAHPMCASFPRMIKIKAHQHQFLRTYCLHRVKKLEKAICKLCCEKVNIECGAYYCKVCDYIIHMKCAKQDQDINSEANELEDYNRHLVYLVEGLNVEEDKTVDVPSKINHNSHPQHELILRLEDSENDKQLYKNDKQCEVCMQFIIFPPFYSCDGCKIFVHKRCVELPKTLKRQPFGENPFTLSSHLSKYMDGAILCHICHNYRHGHFYESEYRRIDVQCFLIPETISHKCHGHFLHVPILRDTKLEKICIGCGQYISGRRPYLICADCKLWLCFKCATLPPVARYRYHPHLLELTSTCKDDQEECYCLICEEKLDPKYWIYSCANCDFSAHIQCVIGNSLKIGRHEHPMICVSAPMNSSKCHLCETSFKYYEDVLECPQCKFNFHFKCYYGM